MSSTLRSTGGGRRSPKRQPPVSLAPSESMVADPALRPPPLQLSLLTPTRIPPPVSYKAPPRAPDAVSLLTDDATAHRKLFDQLKSKVRSTTKSSISAKSDFAMLASASKRSGDASKAAQALFSLGVTHDNSKAYGKAIDAYKRFLTAMSDTGDMYARCLGFNAIAIAYHNMGDFPNSLLYHARHAKNQIIALCNAGLVQRKMGRLTQARECCRSALEIAISAGDSSGEMLASGLLGITSTASGTSDAAGWEPHSGAEPGAGAGAGAALGATAPADAPPHRDGDARAAEDEGDSKRLSEVQAEVGRMALERQLYLQSVTDDPRNRAVAHQQLGLLAHASGNHDEAFEHFKQARSFSLQHKDTGRSLLDKCHMGIAAASQRMEEHFLELRQRALAGAVPSTGAPPSPSADGDVVDTGEREGDAADPRADE